MLMGGEKKEEPVFNQSLQPEGLTAANKSDPENPIAKLTAIMKRMDMQETEQKEDPTKYNTVYIYIYIYIYIVW